MSLEIDAGRMSQVSAAMLEADKRIGDATPVERVLAAYVVLAAGLGALTEDELALFNRVRDHLAKRGKPAS